MPFVCAYNSIEFPSSCQEISYEHERYDPFVRIFNDALHYLKDLKVEQWKYRPASKLDILFCRNAENEIHGCHVGADDSVPTKTRRKPDIFLTSSPAASRVFRLDMKESKPQLVQRLGEQPSGHFTWHDVLSAWEFRLDPKTLKTLPTSFDTALHGEYETIAVTSRTKPKLKDSGQEDEGVPGPAQGPTRSGNSTRKPGAVC